MIVTRFMCRECLIGRQCGDRGEGVLVTLVVPHTIKSAFLWSRSTEEISGRFTLSVTPNFWSLEGSIARGSGFEEGEGTSDMRHYVWVPSKEWAGLISVKGRGCREGFSLSRLVTVLGEPCCEVESSRHIR